MRKYWIELCIFFGTILIVSSYGINQFPILKDLGFFSYIGQEVLRGQPLYSTIFIKPPVVALFFAASMSIFSFLPMYLSIRVVMLFVLASLSVMFYRISLKMFNNKLYAVLSVIILISFTFFVELSLLGDSKTMALFFSFLSLTMLFGEHYITSGGFASIAFLFWQPFGVFLSAPLIFPFLQNDSNILKIRKLLRTCIGFLVPILVLMMFFSSQDLINYSILYPLKYESSNVSKLSMWTVLNVLGYYSSEFFFLVLGLIGILYFSCTKNKYIISFALPFLLLLLALTMDFDDGSDLTVILPVFAVSASLALSKIHSYVTKTTSVRMSSIFLILIVSTYGFLPAFQPVYPENPIIRDRHKFIRKVSPLELISNIQKEYGVRSVFLFLFRRKGEQMTIQHQLELAKMIQDNTEPNEKILSLNAPEILFLSNRRNLNQYPLFEGAGFYEMAKDRGELKGIKDDILSYKPKFIIYTNKNFLEKLGIDEFVENNYEEMNFMEYNIYKVIE